VNVRSNSFKNEDYIPDKYTCDGSDISPELEWDQIPNVKSYAIIVEDPDAPGGTFIHWVIYNIKQNKLEENVKKIEKAGVGIQGVNDFGRVGYNGPCPPRSHQAHRYFFYVYALSSELPVKSGVTAEELKRMMEGYMIDKGFIMGKYKRKG